MRNNVIHRPLVVLLIISTVALAVAYQFRMPLTLEMTSPAEEIYLTRGFYPNEETAGVTFRWTSGEAQITLPGIGGGVPLKSASATARVAPCPVEAATGGDLPQWESGHALHAFQ